MRARQRMVIRPSQALGQAGLLKNRAQKIVLSMLAVALLAAAGMAQWSRDPGGRSGRGGFGGNRGDRAGVPDWENDTELPHDKFTFARVQYSGYGRGFGGGWRGGYPDAVAFAVLLANLCVPIIDRYTRPTVYGHHSGAKHDAE